MSRYHKHIYKAYSFGALLGVLMLASALMAIIELNPIIAAAQIN